MGEPSFKLPHNGIPRNPLGLSPDFVHRRPFIPYSVDLEHGPGLRVTSQEPGVVRRFWRAAAQYFGGPRALSWTANEFDSQARGSSGSTRLNYLWSWNGLHYGNQLSRPMSRPALTPSVAAAPPRLITNGNVRNRPVLRVRVPSYGSRVPALNAAGPGSQE